MKLVIQALTLRSEPLSPAIPGYFDERGGTIGRSETNTLALPDPERHVSRLQAEVSFAGGEFSIRNVGSANPIQLNGRSLLPGEAAPLSHGDQLVIGGYEMRANLDGPGVAGAASAPAMDSRAVIGASAGETRTDPPRGNASTLNARPGRGVARPLNDAADPFADLGSASGANSGSDPFADLMASPPPAAAAPSSPAPMPRTPTTGGSTDAGDPFADLLAPPGGREATGMSQFLAPPSVGALRSDRAAAPFDAGLDEMIGAPGASAGSASAPSSLDDLFGLGASDSQGAAAGGDLLDEFLAPGAGTRELGPGDAPSLFGDKPGRAAEPNQPPPSDHTPDLSSAYALPPVRLARPAPASERAPAVETRVESMPAKAAARAPMPANPGRRVEPWPSSRETRAALPAEQAASPEALWKAFCDGAGIALDLPQQLNPQMMRIMGQVMHHAVEGTLKLMAIRAAAKKELRAQVTTIQSKHNNPLKFAVDPGSALLQLLQPPMRGFMPGPEAVRDAMDDLLGHGIGTMAGTRAALHGVLKRFEPARLEGRLASNGLIDTLLPMNRRARLWELYVEYHQHVKEEAQEDFHQLFGQAFVKAYEKQLDRLEASRSKAH